MLRGISFRRIGFLKMAVVFRNGFVIVTVLLFALLLTKQVSAAYWSTSGYVMCTGGGPPVTVQGIGELQWGGQSYFAWGETGVWLWHRSNPSSSWLQISASGAVKYGASNSTFTFSNGHHTSGEWYSTSGHTASFFGGQQNTYSGVKTCP